MTARPPQPRWVVFDFDGTLADSYPCFVAALEAVGPRYRLRPVPPAERDALRHLGARAVMARLGLSWWKVPWVARAVRRRMHADVARIPPFPGVPELLQALQDAGIRTAIVTSNARRNVEAVLGAGRMRSIDAVVCDVAVLGKARALRRLLRSSGIAPTEALYVGDELRDAEAAARVGMPFLGVAWGYTHPDALRAVAPGRVVMTPGELPEAITHSLRG